jgi:hypothetical protein
MGKFWEFWHQISTDQLISSSSATAVTQKIILEILLDFYTLNSHALSLIRQVICILKDGISNELTLFKQSAAIEFFSVFTATLSLLPGKFTKYHIFFECFSLLFTRFVYLTSSFRVWYFFITNLSVFFHFINIFLISWEVWESA